MLVESRKVSDSIVETVHMIRPNHLNSAGPPFWRDANAVDGRNCRDCCQEAYPDECDYCIY